MAYQFKELDIILFKKSGSVFKDFIGNVIEWFQWGLDCKSPEFVHVAVITRNSSGLILFETNPPSAKYKRLSAIDYSKCVILSRTIPLTEDVLRKSREWCRSKKGQEYGYESILKFLWLGLYGRLGERFRKQSREELRKKSPKFNKVCSQLVDDLFYETLSLDILPDIGEDNALPGDIAASKMHQIIKDPQLY
jgi:uncharacterized protein YycO